MADVLLYLVQLSTVLGIDLMDAAQAKLSQRAEVPRGPRAGPQPQVRRAVSFRYTGRFMSYRPFHSASAAAPMGCMMLPACTRAMGARMITTMTNAAT